MKILISGFQKFDGHTENPSENLIHSLNSLERGSLNFEYEGIILPVSFKKAFILLKHKIDLLQPDFVICTGLAYTRAQLTPERVAINYIDAPIPDNDDFQPTHTPIIENAPDGLFSSLPIKTMVKACTDIGVSANISNTAGTYVCNCLMYQVLHYGIKKNFKAGFVHLPPTAQIKPKGGSMPFNDILKGFNAMLSVVSHEEMTTALDATES